MFSTHMKQLSSEQCEVQQEETGASPSLSTECRGTPFIEAANTLHRFPNTPGWGTSRTTDLNRREDAGLEVLCDSGHQQYRIGSVNCAYTMYQATALNFSAVIDSFNVHNDAIRQDYEICPFHR